MSDRPNNPDEALDIATELFSLREQLSAERAKVNELEAQNAVLRDALEEMLEMVEQPPERNCSCHIYAPCSDCVDYSGLRTAIFNSQQALSITPSDAAEMSRKKDELIKSAIHIISTYMNDNPKFCILRNGEAVEQDPCGAHAWSEAARAAGVGVE